MESEQELKRTIKSIKSRLLETQSLGIDINSAVKTFNKVGEARSVGDYNKAFELLNNCNEAIDMALDQKIFKIISDCYLQIKQFSTIDFSYSKVILEDANFQLKKRNYRDALDLAKRCESEIAGIVESNISGFRDRAEEVYNATLAIMNDARQQDDLDIKDAEDILDDMYEKLISAEGIKDYEETIEYGNAIKSALSRAQRRHEREVEELGTAEDTVSKMKLALENVNRHFNLSEEIKIFFKKSQQALEDNDPGKAIEYANECVSKLNEVTENYQPDITMEFVSKDLASEVWNRVNVLIENCGNAVANDVKIELSGPVQVRRLQTIEELKFNDKTSLEIGIKFKGAGSVPIDLEIHARRSWDDRSYDARRELWVDVKREQAGAITGAMGQISNEPRLQVHEELINCIICKKVIEKSTPIVECDCGTIYHLDCTSELDFCMKCGNNLKRISPGPEGEESSAVSWE